MNQMDHTTHLEPKESSAQPSQNPLLHAADEAPVQYLQRTIWMVTIGTVCDNVLNLYQGVTR